MAGKHTEYLILSILCCCAEGDKQVEKLKAVTTKLPHLPVVRITADAGSVPLSRGSEARSVSFVKVKIAFCQTVFFFLLTLDRVLVEASKGSFFSFSFSLSSHCFFF